MVAGQRGAVTTPQEKDDDENWICSRRGRLLSLGNTATSERFRVC